MTPSFNLLDEPWIRVTRLDGAPDEVSGCWVCVWERRLWTWLRAESSESWWPWKLRTSC